eukprot:gene10886-14609_t
MSYTSLFCVLIFACFVSVSFTFRMIPNQFDGKSTNSVFKTSYVLNKNKINIKKNYLQSISIHKFHRPTFIKFKLVEDEDVQVDDKLDTAADDDDDDFSEEESSTLLNKLSKGIIPLAASVGFAVTPSSAVAARVAGAAAGGIAGFLARNIIIQKMKNEIEEDNGDNNNGGNSYVPTAVMSALAYLNSDAGPPILSQTTKTLESIAKKFKIPSDDLGLFFVNVFAEVIYISVQEESMDLTELSDVIDFAESAGLTNDEIGDGFALAACRLGNLIEKDNRGFYSSEYELEHLYQAAKMFFLADKMIGTSEGYYGKRVGVALSFFLPETYQEIISEACTKLFLRCVESVLVNPQDFTFDEVEKLKSFLTGTTSVTTLRPANMQNMIMEAIQLSLDNTLSTNEESLMHVKFDNMEKLAQAQEVFGWDNRELTATIETKTMPIFENIAADIVNQVFERPEKAEELSLVLQERIESLSIDERKARVYLTNVISQMNKEYMNKIDKVYNVSNGAIEPAYKIMIGYSHTIDAFKKLTANIMGDIKLPVPGLPFADMVRFAMYKVQLTRNDLKHSVTNKDMFDMSEEQQQSVRKVLALPKVSTWITQCINENNFDDNAKSAYQKILNDYKVEPEEWQATAIDFYYQAAENVAKSKAIPSASDMERLSTIKSFLTCSDEMVQRVHLELLGDKYVKAVTESMNPTGVIAEEYVDGLKRLQARLNLNNNDTNILLGVAARTRINPIIKDLTDIWKSDTDATYRREKEKKSGKVTPDKKSVDLISSSDNILGYMETGAQKEGGGPNVFMREALNLVDFFTENYKINGIDINSNTSTLSLAVTAVGITNETDLVGMYKHYMITRLSEQDATLRQRYIETEPLFALILGIPRESQMKIKESLAFTAFKNMLKNALVYRDMIEANELQQFAMLQNSLQIDVSAAEKIYAEASKQAIMDHASTLFKAVGKDATSSMTAEVARRFRSQYLIENGLENDLLEVQEAYDIPVERAEEIIEMSCKRYISQLLNLALRGAKKYDEQDAVKWLKQIVKYAVFVNGQVEADGNLFTENDKKRLISFYQSEVESQLTNQSSSSNESEVESDMKNHDMIVKLKEMIYLTNDFIPPVQGMAGLLGEVKSLATLQNEADPNGGKKGWAWG